MNAPIGGGSYKWLVLFNVMLTTFMAVLDSTVEIGRASCRERVLVAV